MADNVPITAGSGTTIATDDVGGGVQVQRTKTTWGPDGTANDVDVASGKSFPVQLRAAGGTELDLGTQTTSAAILAKISADPATATLQASTNTKLDMLHTDLATTLAGYVDGLETLGSAEATLLGAVTETAPATDTASSGLNGRLQRVAQRLTTLITAVGTQVFGVGTAAAAQRMTLASDDPAVTVLGAKADAKSAATDTTSISAMSVWKQVSASVQLMVFGAGTAAAAQRTTLASDDPAVTALGATSGAKVITDANGSVQQYLRGLVSQWISSTLTLASRGYSAAVTLTRTADTNAYAANDALGAATGSTAALTFASMGPSGAEITLTGAALEIDAAAVITGETSYRLYLYSVTPPSALGDNTAWDLPSGDRASFLGYVDLGTPVDLGSTLYVQADINRQVKLSGTSLFGYLVTNGAYTPTSARVHVITLHAVA